MGEEICPGQGFIYIYTKTLTLNLKNMVQSHYSPFNQRHSVGEVWGRLGQWERRYAPDKQLTFFLIVIKKRENVIFAGSFGFIVF